VGFDSDFVFALCEWMLTTPTYELYLYFYDPSHSMDMKDIHINNYHIIHQLSNQHHIISYIVKK
jgi:hypothetical protein